MRTSIGRVAGERNCTASAREDAEIKGAVGIVLYVPGRDNIWRWSGIAGVMKERLHSTSGDEKEYCVEVGLTRAGPNCCMWGDAKELPHREYTQPSTATAAFRGVGWFVQ